MLHSHNSNWSPQNLAFRILCLVWPLWRINEMLHSHNSNWTPQNLAFRILCLVWPLWRINEMLHSHNSNWSQQNLAFGNGLCIVCFFHCMSCSVLARIPACPQLMYLHNSFSNKGHIDGLVGHWILTSCQLHRSSWVDQALHKQMHISELFSYNHVNCFSRQIYRISPYIKKYILRHNYQLFEKLCLMFVYTLCFIFVYEFVQLTLGRV